MRARNIKPSIFKNEVLGTADPLLTILFEGLWCEADRDGRLEDRPLRLKAEILPYRDHANIDAMLEWLATHGFIARYQVQDAKIIQVLKFSDHQRPHTNELASVLPAWDASKHNQGKKRAQPRRQALCSDSPSLIPSSLIPDSGSLIPDSLMLPSEAMSDAKAPDDAQMVFDHWRQTHNHPHAVFDINRRRLILKWLKQYSVATLCQSITGYLNSPHHMGRNESNTRYDSIELLLRDAKRIDAGLKFHVDPPRVELSEKTRRIIDQTEDWSPPEVRNASH